MSFSTEGDSVLRDHDGLTKRHSASRLARRARSFKDDFLDILYAMRSPSNNSSSRSNSPKFKSRHRSKSPKQRLSSASDPYDSAPDNPLRELELNVKQVQFALRHFQDVVSKNKLEVLPGNGTIVLETVANIHSVLKSYAFDEQSSVMVSGLNQVYQSVAKLIKLCDDLLMSGEKALNKEYVTEIIHLVDDAIQNLVTVATDKLAERDARGVYSESSASSRCSTVSSDPSQYRVSLPEIPLTSHERNILEQTSQLDRHVISNVLEETPPSKPPLPNRTFTDSPPPLPPKRRQLYGKNSAHSIGASPASLSLERLSLKSDNSSITSLESAGGNKIDTCSSDNFSRATNEWISSSSSLGYASSQCYSEHLHVNTNGNVLTTSTDCRTTASTEIRHTDSIPIFDEVPPELPIKTRKIKRNRFPSQYDNVPIDQQLSPKFEIEINGDDYSQSDTPPPLPMKRKHIMAYMEMFGNCMHGETPEFSRHSVHTYNMLQTEWQTHEIALSSSQSCSLDFSNSSLDNTLDDVPPELPPKKIHLKTSQPHTDRTFVESVTPPTMLPLKPALRNDSSTESTYNSCGGGTPIMPTKDMEGEEELNALSDPLAEIDVTQWIVYKKPDEDGSDIRGGNPDALIVLATKANKNDFLYQEAFLTTYRTFLCPFVLIEKLISRYHRFESPSDCVRQRAAKESFSLLVRVVDDLTVTDLDDNLLHMVMEFVYQLLCSGDLIMGKALRVKLLEKYHAKQKYRLSCNGALSSQNIYTRQATLLDFKSEHMAEQMTLLDADLFINIEIPEVLTWTQEQNEEKSPNLTRFTEHFNKMSYWARSRILEQPDAKDRERYVVKFIKIMKHLRKMNNFNSYLALLSALDSAPIRRLEWQKHITEGLKEYCALIDSSSSFRAYRQALAETQPPCIPYIGLVLQDLTFVHIGNNDYLSEGIINFSKRWQQFNIVENMKRFKKIMYNFKSHERIIAFFSNFDEFLCEDAMWQISESIKPRGGRKIN